MRCQLCMAYHNAERVQEKTKIGKDKEIIITNRYCPHRDAIVNEDDDGCEKFTPTRFFWCGWYDSWVELTVCQKRQKQDNKWCPCSVGYEANLIQAPPRTVKKKLVIRKIKKQLVIRRPKS